ncbi:MAG TPA: hypothetical protein VIY56_10800 [Vicinamibacterales bacterium]
MTWPCRTAVAAVMVVGVSAAPGAAAQTARVTAADIQRLQDNVYLAERDLGQLRQRDAARATELQAQLDELGDEVVYLRVKLRKERTLARSEYTDVETRIDAVRNSARGTANPVAAAPPRPAPSAPPAPARTSGPPEIPAGTELDVRLSTLLSSGTAKVEDRFEATTLVDLIIDGRTLVPAGAVMRGLVSSVEPATRTNRTARMTLSFDQLTFEGRTFPLRGTLTQAVEGEGIRGEVGRTAAGAGVGAIIGGILGGLKGALAGLFIGGGGTIAATEGKEVELPQGSVLRVRVESPVPL